MIAAAGRPYLPCRRTPHDLHAGEPATHLRRQHVAVVLAGAKEGHQGSVGLGDARLEFGHGLARIARTRLRYADRLLTAHVRSPLTGAFKAAPDG